jgi:hypothetical protein
MWPTDRFRRKSGDAAPRPETPLALIGRDGRRRVVLAADAAARAAGLRIGMPASKAHARTAHLPGYAWVLCRSLSKNPAEASFGAPAACEEIQSRMLEACQKVAANHGLVASKVLVGAASTPASPSNLCSASAFPLPTERHSISKRTGSSSWQSTMVCSRPTLNGNFGPEVRFSGYRHRPQAAPLPDLR